MYTLKFTAEAIADIKGLPKGSKNSLKAELTGKLAVDPEGCSMALRDSLDGFRSFHWRSYRIVFGIFEDLKAIAVVGVGKKDHDPDLNIYRRLEAAAERGALADKVLSTIRGFSVKR